MDWLHQIEQNSSTKEKLTAFLSNYGVSGLEAALQHFIDMQQEYIIKTKSSTTRIKINDIYYIEISGHNIITHTNHGIYQKYGTLTNELKFLSNHGFIKCNQSCLVSLDKIKNIHTNKITLVNDEILHMSRNCTPKVLSKISQYHSKYFVALTTKGQE